MPDDAIENALPSDNLVNPVNPVEKNPESRYVLYDAADRPLTKSTYEGTSSFGYDVCDRLISENDPISGLATLGYDLAGRRTSMATPAGKFSYSYDIADEMLVQTTPSGSITYGYDLNGSRTSQVSGNSRTTYVWDPRNRLSSVKLPSGQIYTQAYRYDDMRLSESGPSGIATFIWSGGAGGAVPLALREGQGEGAHSGSLPDVLGVVASQSGSQMQQVFAHGSGTNAGAGGALVRAMGSHADSSPINRSFHLDNQGGVLALTTATGSIEADYHTDSWGNVISGTAADNPFIYLGGLGYWQEPSLSLNYVRARWYEPSTGSWLSVDPVRTEPRYAYVHGSPTIFVDPSGLDDGALQGIRNAISGGLHRIASGVTSADRYLRRAIERGIDAIGADIRGDLDAFGSFMMRETSPDKVLAGMDQLMRTTVGVSYLSTPDGVIVVVATQLAVRVWKRSLRLYYKILPLLPVAIANSMPHSQADIWAWEFDFVLYGLLGFVQQSIQQIPGVNQVLMLQQFVDDYHYFAQVGLTFDTIFNRFVEDPLMQAFKELVSTRNVTAQLLGPVLGAIIATLFWGLVMEVIDAIAAPETAGASEIEGAIEAASDAAELKAIVARLRKHSKGWLIDGIEKHPKVVDAIKRTHAVTTTGKIGYVRSLAKSAPGRLLGEIRKLLGAAPPRKGPDELAGSRKKPSIPSLDGVGWKVIGLVRDGSVVGQATENMCGHAVAEMLLESHGKRGATQKDMHAWHGGGKKDERVGAEGMAILMNRAEGGNRWSGRGVAATESNLKNLAETGPFGAVVKSEGDRHAVLVDGIDGKGRVMVRDPWAPAPGQSGTRYLVDEKEFVNHWAGWAVWNREGRR